MEYSTVDMLKPKEYILDPETNRIFQVVVIRLTGTKPRIMMRDLRTQKITEEVFSPRKQFLRIVPENPKYTLTYYQENRLYVLNVDTFEELELDGSGFVNLAELKAGFDAGRTVVIQIEKIEDIKRIISFEATVEAVAKAPQPRETSPPPLTQATSARTKSRDEAQLALSSSAKLDSGKAIAKSNFGTSTEKGKNLSKSVPANAKRPQAESKGNLFQENKEIETPVNEKTSLREEGKEKQAKREIKKKTEEAEEKRAKQDVKKGKETKKVKETVKKEKPVKKSGSKA